MDHIVYNESCEAPVNHGVQLAPALCPFPWGNDEENIDKNTSNENFLYASEDLHSKTFSFQYNFYLEFNLKNNAKLTDNIKQINATSIWA